jgi:hypothetical protein
MTRAGCLALSAFALCFLPGCRSGVYPQDPALRVYFPKIIVYGAYAHTLTVEDLRQISDAARKRTDITLRISRIDVEAPNHVRVTTEDSRVVDHKFFQIEFIVDKKGGVWAIDNRSIKKQQGTVDTGNEPDERTIVN